MATTKGKTAIWNAQPLSGGGGPTSSSKITLTDAYAIVLMVKLTNGATAPTTPAQIQVQLTPDSATEEWYDFGGPLVGSATNSGVESWSFEIPAGAMYLQLVATHGDTQAVTVDADVSELTAI